MDRQLKSGRFAVSTWSLHRLLGPVYRYSPDPDKSAARSEPYGPGNGNLLDIPGQLASRGINRLEICSFHLESRSRAYCEELRDALAGSGVLLQTLLVEDGDPSDVQTAERDSRWIADWAETAAHLGAERMRVIAGKQAPNEENLGRSARHLRQIADHAEAFGIRVVTENWFDLLPAPQQTNWLLDRLEGKVGLNGDLGNWSAPAKYDGLADIMRRAEICHAKANYDGQGIDAADYRKSLEACRTAGYEGPYTLIYDSPFFADEWDGILLQKEFIEQFHQEKQLSNV
ncbi:sugar phosphate isomerase/epimerase (plasmid) [Rhizobium grahamii]|uniref:Sugar phosphate isomerase/epimerase n=1 Tax=Rhizobium grahamii TaxID=1120045 RepID=A0A5Q0CFN3_9HYPH|nr:MULTISPECIES: TIM barrel protein [Rhizobium]QFY62649.1 sugar phosphate isomerase/epimerase [Rhizobium grahamii]QRM52610.1 sugar phosphate isomerase/epimerase [Rhizobium sp. BG6]